MREPMEENDEEGSETMDHICFGGLLWLCAKHGGRMGKPEGHVLRREIQSK